MLVVLVVLVRWKDSRLLLLLLLLVSVLVSVEVHCVDVLVVLL